MSEHDVIPKDDPNGQHHRPGLYVPSQTIVGSSQDPEALDDARVLSLITQAHVAGRGPLEAARYAANQSVHPSQNWAGLCGMFTRSCLDIPARDPSAVAMFWGADPDSRHRTTDADDAPEGHPFCWAGGSEGFGHIDLPAWPFPSGNPGAWSNDLVTVGRINKVDRNAPTFTWHQKPLGYLDELNGYDLKTRKPKDSKPYKGLQRSINNKEHALETAKAEHDAHDVKVLKASIARDKRLYEKLRHS